MTASSGRCWLLGTASSGTAVAVEGDFDVTLVPGFDKLIASLPVDASTRVVVDLSATDLLDSSGIGALLRCHRLLVGAGASMEVLAPRPFQQRLFHITGVAELLGVHAPE